MLTKFRRGMETWGHYLLALLCAGAILLSAVWTQKQQAAENADQAALSDQGQRLAEVQGTLAPDALARPAAGAVTRGFSAVPVYFPETGVWRTHPSLDFAAAEGEPVCALAAGTVVSCENGIRVNHGNGCESLYRGILKSKVRVGQKVRAGEALGTAGGAAPYEGAGHVCVTLYQDGLPIPFGEEWD